MRICKPCNSKMIEGFNDKMDGRNKNYELWVMNDQFIADS